MSELLACPFCGGEARHYAPGPIDHHIECVECYADIHRDTEAEAVAAWNTRHERTCEVVKEFVDIGGERMTDYTCCLNQSGWGHNYCPNCGCKVVDE